MQPAVLFTIWTPFIFSITSVAQHFDGYRWSCISGSWFRCTMWLIFWSLFGIFGYASNWGVFLGFINCLWTTPLYLMSIFLHSEYPELPVLNFGSEVIKEHAKKLSVSKGVIDTKPDESMADYLKSRGAIIGMLPAVFLFSLL